MSSPGDVQSASWQSTSCPVTVARRDSSLRVYCSVTDYCCTGLLVEGLHRIQQLEMCANAQRDGRPAEHRWRPLFNAAEFG